MRSRDDLLHGAIGGILAGAVVALWFLAYDTATTQPLHTPSVLAGAILGGEPATPSVRLVAGYSVLHLAVFALLGVAAAAFLRVVKRPPGVLLGAVFGLAVQNTVHYGALLLTGARVLTLLPPGQVLAANVVGGVVMMGYLSRATRSQAAFGPAMLRYHPLLAEGLMTGVVGAGVVALWFLLLDALRGAPFYTPAALGSVLLLGAQTVADVHVTAGVVAAYTVFHILAFAAVGIAMVWSAVHLGRMPSMWLMGLLSVIMVEGLFMGVMGALATSVMGVIGRWALAVANLLAVAAMARVIWVRHPELRTQLANAAVATRL